MSAAHDELDKAIIKANRSTQAYKIAGDQLRIAQNAANAIYGDMVEADNALTVAIRTYSDALLAERGKWDALLAERGE